MDFLHRCSLMGTTLPAVPNNSMPFRQIIMYILQCPHDINVHLFCFDLHKLNLFLLRSRAATCPLKLRARDIAGAGACFDRSLFYMQCFTKFPFVAIGILLLVLMNNMYFAIVF